MASNRLGLADRQARAFGDFQTPPDLAGQACAVLREEYGCAPDAVLEPTCGTGRFLVAAREAFPGARWLTGVELRPSYAEACRAALAACAERAGSGREPEVRIVVGDAFRHDFAAHGELAAARELLIVGNPPWQTNAGQGALASGNVPDKRNRAALRGVEAITGKSNFDLAEAVILRMLDVFAGRRATLAMLVKNSVVRRLVRQLPQLGIPLADMRQYRFDAMRAFGVAADASLFVARLGAGAADDPESGGSASEPVCRVYELDDPREPSGAFGWSGGRFVADLAAYAETRELDGACPLEWRSGVKHDCAGALELTRAPDGGWRNKRGEAADVEPDRLYPLRKSADLQRSPRGRRSPVWLALPQRKPGEPTEPLAAECPRLWAYLNANLPRFAARKSAVYRGKPLFSVFGIGDYSFAPYKVAISGMYKEPWFSLVEPVGGRPAMLDDTCYFLGFADRTEALFAWAVLNGEPVRRLLAALAFPDGKRPYTKDALMRIDLAGAARRLGGRKAIAWLRGRAEAGAAEGLSEEAFLAFVRSLEKDR